MGTVAWAWEREARSVSVILLSSIQVHSKLSSQRSEEERQDPTSIDSRWTRPKSTYNTYKSITVNIYLLCIFQVD